MHRTNVLVLFDLSTGKIIRQISVKDVRTSMASIAVSENAEWIVLSGSTGKDWNEKIILLDRNGKRHWENLSEQKTLGSSLAVVDISTDGKTFKVEDRGKSKKKFVYSNIKGNVKLEKVIRPKKQ